MPRDGVGQPANDRRATGRYLRLQVGKEKAGPFLTFPCEIIQVHSRQKESASSPEIDGLPLLYLTLRIQLLLFQPAAGG